MLVWSTNIQMNAPPSFGSSQKDYCKLVEPTISCRMGLDGILSLIFPGICDHIYHPVCFATGDFVGGQKCCGVVKQSSGQQFRQLHLG